MLLAVVVAHHRCVQTVVAGIVAMCCIVELMAVMVVMHEGMHICMVMCQVQRSGMAVVVRPVIPVPG